MARWWDWEKPYLERWEALPTWAKLLTFPLLAPLLCIYGLLKLLAFLCLFPLLLFIWGRRPQRPVEEITLEELRTRAERLVTWFAEDLTRNPGADDVLQPGMVFSRYLARALSRPACPPELARHRAQRTLVHLRNWKGIRYFALKELASDVVRWSEHQPPS